MASSNEPLELVARSLATVLAPEYVKLAFNLPPTSLTIWNFLIDDIHALEESESTLSACDTEQVLGFISRFFSPQVVESVSKNLDDLSTSYLGLTYTFRHGKALLARTIVHDIMDMHVCEKKSSLHNFFGVCEGQISESLKEKIYLIIEAIYCRAKELYGDDESQIKDEWRTPKKVFKKKDHKEEDKGGRRGGGGGDVDAGSGSGGSGNNKSRKLLNDNVQVVDVWMPKFTTPSKNIKDKKETLARRLLVFMEHNNVEQGVIYDPFILGSIQNEVFLYHGTRTSSLKSFCENGIVPKSRPNEFSRGSAFYASNALRQAFEHPLHRSISRAPDPVSVIVFKVDAEILHGGKAPFPNERPFDVKWFPESNKESEEFCLNNLKEQGRPHEADLVIGPICLRFPNMEGASELWIPLDNGARVTQVAFCSLRARDWLQTCAFRVYREKRSQT